MSNDLACGVPVEVPHLSPHGVVDPHDTAVAVAVVVLVEAVLTEPGPVRRRRRALDADKGNL